MPVELAVAVALCAWWLWFARLVRDPRQRTVRRRYFITYVIDLSPAIEAMQAFAEQMARVQALTQQTAPAMRRLAEAFAEQRRQDEETLAALDFEPGGLDDVGFREELP